jgi:glycosyltransferase involved in cell wall biosynthesis
LRDYLVAGKAPRVTFVAHPLEHRQESRHVVTTYERGVKTSETLIRALNRPPYTYPLDLVLPFRLPACDVWFGFNNLACLRGLIRRRAGRAGKVFYWAVDFVPGRFGPGPATRVYDRVDRFACRHADGRIELSTAALEGRAGYLGLREDETAPTTVAPMGAWLDRVPTVSDDAWRRRKVVFLGHLVERQGVGGLLEALAILGPGVTADIIGGGPLESTLREHARRLGVDVVFHGFVDDYRDVEAILAGGSVAVAPYVVRDDNFTRYADPGKLKAYLAAGLPIVLTGVPPNAAEIARDGGGTIVGGSPAALADGIQAVLSDGDAWAAASRAARTYVGQFDWNVILSRTLAPL